MKRPVRLALLWERAFLLMIVGTIAFICSLMLAPGEARAHGAHAAGSSVQQGVAEETAGEAADETNGAMSRADCVTCCASAGCFAATIGVNPAMPDFEVPRGAYVISPAVSAYHATRQGLRRPPRLAI